MIVLLTDTRGPTWVGGVRAIYRSLLPLLLPLLPLIPSPLRGGGVSTAKSTENTFSSFVSDACQSFYAPLKCQFLMSKEGEPLFFFLFCLSVSEELPDWMTLFCSASQVGPTPPPPPTSNPGSATDYFTPTSSSPTSSSTSSSATTSSLSSSFSSSWSTSS